MRTKSVTFSLAIVTLMVGVWSSGAQAGGTAHPVICQAYLTALDKVDKINRTNPIVSIQELQDYLLRSRGLSRSLDISETDPYNHENYIDSFLKPTRLSVGRFFFKTVIARIAQLHRDMTTSEPNIARVGIELRGEKAVTQYMQFLDEDFAKSRAEVDAALDKKYPRLRVANVLHGALQSVLFGFAAYIYMEEPNAIGYLGSGMAMYVSAMLELANRLLPLSNQSSGIEKQLEIARKCSRGECSDFPVTIVSGHLEVPTEFHRALMGSQNVELQEVVQLSEKSRKTVWDEWVEGAKWMFSVLTKRGYATQYIKMVNDLAERVKNSPDGITRSLYYDSIFYMDPVSGEPVWLVFYRALNDHPVFKPPKKKEEDKAVEESWDSGQMLPGYLPVPTR